MHSHSIERWAGKSIFVIGDVIIDNFVYGNVERISPEAPIPVLNYQRNIRMLGGAGNVARNIVALGGRVWLAGVVGDDENGDRAVTEAEQEGIATLFVRLPGHPTTVKTRYVAGSHQIMRLDIEKKLALDEQAQDRLFQSFKRVLPEVSVVVLSDYAKGVLSPALISEIIKLARDNGTPVVVDPKSKDVRRYSGSTVITPNTHEAEAITGIACDGDNGADKAARRLSEMADAESVILTRGPDGMTIFNGAGGAGEIEHIPTVATEVFDVSGAGDTVVATLALALSTGADVVAAAYLANMAAGIVVGKAGTATVSSGELIHALSKREGPSGPKIVDINTAVRMVEDWRKRGIDVGFTNGCFDIIHPGHIQILRGARAVCERLVVALNSDASVKRLKGESRPVQNQNARAKVMASIEGVDAVVIFDQDTPEDIIRRLRPDCVIKGADYLEDQVVGGSFVKSYGGRVVLIDLEQGQSTTNIIERASLGEKKL